MLSIVTVQERRFLKLPLQIFESVAECCPITLHISVQAVSCKIHTVNMTPTIFSIQKQGFKMCHLFFGQLNPVYCVDKTQAVYRLTPTHLPPTHHHHIFLCSSNILEAGEQKIGKSYKKKGKEEEGKKGTYCKQAVRWVELLSRSLCPAANDE